MRCLTFILLFCWYLPSLPAQGSLNQHFEEINPENGGLAAWVADSRDRITHLDTQEVHGGRSSLRLHADADRWYPISFSQSIPAIFRGKTVRLSGFIKTAGVHENGWASLMLVTYKASGMASLKNMGELGPHGNTAWTQYVMEAPLDSTISEIRIGGVLLGPGSAWFDDFQLSIDGVPIEEAPFWKPKNESPIVKSGIEWWGELSPEYIRDLALLCQVWGFLKYHHPTVARGALDWDRELLEVMRRCHYTNTEHRDRWLIEWIDALGPLPYCARCSEKTKATAVLPADQRWRESKALGAKLRNKLQEVYDHREMRQNHYVQIDPQVKNPVFTHEAAYAEQKFPDGGLRLLALFRFWNIVQYFSPNRDVIGEDWNAVLVRFIPRVIGVKNALEYKLVMRELIGTIHDSHANLWIQDNELRHYFGDLRPPVQVRFVENQLTVTGFYHAELARNTPLRPGDVISHIRNVPVDTLVARRQHLYPASNRASQLRDLARDLLRSNDPELPITMKHGTDTVCLTIPCYDPFKNKYLQAIDFSSFPPDSCYRFLQPDIGYLYLGNVHAELLPGIVEQFRNTKGLIIDIRNYPAEFVPYKLVGLLKKEESPFVYATHTAVGHPGTFVRTDARLIGNEQTQTYRGKIIVLVNEITQSQAEYTTMALQSMPGTLVMGSTTAGADGNVSEFSLPGGLETMISGIGMFYPDGKPTQRVGIVPDIWAEPTVAGIRAGRDEVLEKAVEWINKH